MADDEQWMRRARQRAREAGRGGNAPVGCVIVSAGGTLVAEAGEAVIARNDPAAHAEIEAIRAACALVGHRDLRGCTLYTNVEPCILCSYAIRDTGIARVVIGEPVEGIGGATSRFPILTTTEIADFGEPPEIVWLPDPAGKEG